MNNFKGIQSVAWRRMFLKRACPPLGVLRRGGANAEKHLELCEDCREKLKLAQACQTAASALAASPEAAPQESNPRPGDIYRVRPLGKPEDWFDRNGRYHNPPFVLILEGPGKAGFYKVAQIFDEPGLSAMGDVDLAPTWPGYAEAWNIYGLPCAAFCGEPLARVDSRLRDRVLEAAKLEYGHLDITEPLFNFRSLETETGSSFSLPLNEMALREYEQAAEKEGERVAFFNSLATSAAQTAENYAALLQESLKKWSEKERIQPRAAASLDIPEFNNADSVPADEACAPELSEWLNKYGREDGADGVFLLPCLLVFEHGDLTETIPAKIVTRKLRHGYALDALIAAPGLELLAWRIEWPGMETQETLADAPALDVWRLRARFGGNGDDVESVKLGLLVKRAGA